MTGESDVKAKIDALLIEVIQKGYLDLDESVNLLKAMNDRTACGGCRGHCDGCK